MYNYHVETGIIEFDGVWLKFDHQGCRVSARTAMDPSSGRLRVKELSIENEQNLTGEMLRTLPLRWMEAFINRRYRFSEEEPPPIRLKVPKGTGKKPDEFYRQVAAAYEYLSESTRAPAAEIARRNRVEPSTAHRWIREAKARGMLARGQKGKAT